MLTRSCSLLCISSSLSKTPHFGTWTSLCQQHLMDRFPLQALCGAAHRVVLLQALPQCCVGLGLAMVLLQRVWYCFRPSVQWWRVLCSLLGGIVPVWCMCACLCYRPVCQDGDSFTLRDLRVPTVVHLWPKLFCSRARVKCVCVCVCVCVVDMVGEHVCLCVWLTCSVC